jgi:hypothetical protein
MDQALSAEWKGSPGSRRKYLLITYKGEPQLNNKKQTVQLKNEQPTWIRCFSKEDIQVAK